MSVCFERQGAIRQNYQKPLKICHCIFEGEQPDEDNEYHIVSYIQEDLIFQFMTKSPLEEAQTTNEFCLAV